MRNQELFHRLQQSIEHLPYAAEVIWKQGRSVEADASGLQFPLHSTLSQGGRVVLSDGNWQGAGAFDSLDRIGQACEQARQQVAAQQIPAAARTEREPRQICDDPHSAAFALDRAELDLLQEMQRQMAERAAGQMVLKLRTDDLHTYYLDSGGDRLYRHELWSSLDAEVLDPAKSQLRFKHSLHAVPAAEQLRRMEAEFLQWAEPEAREEAEEFVSGVYPCLLSAKATGYFLHEVVGHLFEADTETARRLHTHRGRQVAPDFVTIGEVPSHRFDDEGTPTGETWMIRDGQIHDLLHSRSTAAQFGQAANGHGRSLFGHQPPIPRMQNTVLQPGTASEAELSRTFKQMVYVQNADGGHSRNGEFVLQVNEAYLLADGEPVKRLGRLIMRGSCMKSLAEILAVGQGPETHTFSCMKADQNGLIVSATAPPMVLNSIWIGKH